MSPEDLATLPMEDEALREDVVALIQTIGQALHGADTEAVMWALSAVVTDALQQGADDIGHLRTLFGTFTWNVHQGLEGAVQSVQSVGEMLDLTTPAFPTGCCAIRSGFRAVSYRRER